MITLFVYLDLADKAHNNWIARSIWRDPTNTAAKLVHFTNKVNDSVEDIDIEFADESKHQTWRKFLIGKVSTKTEFVKKVQLWIPQSDTLIKEANDLVLRLDNGTISQSDCDSRMIVLSRSYSKIEEQYDNGTTGPIECRDAEASFVATIGSGSSVFLPFTPQGLKTWDEPARRNTIVRIYLERYFADHQMLEFEIHKLTRP